MSRAEVVEVWCCFRAWASGGYSWRLASKPARFTAKTVVFEARSPETAYRTTFALPLPACDDSGYAFIARTPGEAVEAARAACEKQELAHRSAAEVLAAQVVEIAALAVVS